MGSSRPIAAGFPNQDTRSRLPPKVKPFLVGIWRQNYIHASSLEACRTVCTHPRLVRVSFMLSDQTGWEHVLKPGGESGK